MLTIGLAILLIVLGLLAIPLGLNYRVNWRGRFQGDIRLIWLFGLVRLRMPGNETTASQPKPKSRRARRHRPRRKRKTHPLAAWQLRPFRQRLIRFGQDLWQAIHKRDVRVQLRIGLDDPADTGQLWALMGPLAALAGVSQSVNIAIQPDFNQSTFEFDSSGRIRLIPLQLIGLSLGLLLSPSFWQGLRRMRKAG
ncbi:MAG: DUF2953 domain-containing protein [Gammaproteobacteria bacterium]|jgi:hypothetical protein